MKYLGIIMDNMLGTGVNKNVKSKSKIAIKKALDHFFLDFLLNKMLCTLFLVIWIC